MSVASCVLLPSACLLLVLSSSSSSNCDLRSTAFPAGPQSRPSLPVFPAGPQPRASPPSVPCHAQCSLPDLNHDHPRPVFPAGPQPRPSPPSVPCRTSTRPSPPSVPCRTSTASIHAKCSLPDLNRKYPRQVFPAGAHVGRYVR